MTMRRHLSRLRALQAVQQVERDLAERDHAAACQNREACHAAASGSVAMVRDVAESWYGARATGRFDPQRDALLAAALIDAEQRAGDCARAVTIADAACEHAADAWRAGEARRRAGERVARVLAEQIARRMDEALMDLITTRMLHRRQG